MEHVGADAVGWAPPAGAPRKPRPPRLVGVAAAAAGGAEPPVDRTLSSISVVTPSGSVASSQSASASSSFDDAAVTVVVPDVERCRPRSPSAASSASSARPSSPRAPSSRGSASSSRASSASSASSRASSSRPAPVGRVAAAVDRLSRLEAPADAADAAAAPALFPYGPPLTAAAGRCASELGPSTTSSSSLRVLPRPKVFIARTAAAALASRDSRGRGGDGGDADGGRRVSVDSGSGGAAPSRRPRSRKPRASPREPARDQALAVRCASTPRPSESAAGSGGGGAPNRRLLRPGDDFGALLAGRVSLLEPVVVVAPDLDRAVTVLAGDDDASFSGLPPSASAFAGVGPPFAGGGGGVGGGGGAGCRDGGGGGGGGVTWQ